MLRPIYQKIYQDFGLNKRPQEEKEKLESQIQAAMLIQIEKFLRRNLPFHLREIFVSTLKKLDREKDFKTYLNTLSLFLEQLPHARFRLNAWMTGYFSRVKYSLLK